jgi:hypothetical protein
MVDRLVFDTTDADTQAESSNVGAYLRASDGTLLTHTDVGGKKALDVRIAEGINVEVDLDAADDSVASHLFDGAGTAITSTLLNGTDQSLDVNIANATVAITATDLDIRDMTHVSDSIKIGDGTEFMLVNVDGSINSVVTATDLDIRDLSSTTDSIQSELHDGAGTALTSTLNGGKQSLDVHISGSDPLTVNDAALADTAIANAVNTLAVAATAEDVVASPLANRKYLLIYNNDNRVAYIGSTGVTAANGFPLSPSSMMELRCGASVDIEFVSPKLGHEIRTLELS